MSNETEEELYAQEEMKPRTSGLYCFMDATRVCGAECMAYVTHPRSSASSELAEQQQHCALLNSAERLGRNVTALASIAAKDAKDRQDQIRAKHSRPDGSGTSSPFPPGTR